MAINVIFTLLLIGAFWGFQATVPQVRTGLVSMTNTVIIVREKMFTIGESRPITGTQEKRREMQQWSNHGSNLGQNFQKRAKIKIQVRVTLQTSFELNVSGDVSPKCVSVWLFNYRQNLVFFPSSLH